jgi:DNA-directed RNA polymerase specialized sigma24 family protein
MTTGETVASSPHHGTARQPGSNQEVENRVVQSVHRHKDLLVDYLFQMTGSPERAIELALQTAAKLRRAPAGSDPRAWLVKEATRLVGREERSERWRNAVFPWTRRRDVHPAFEEGITPGAGVSAWEKLEKDGVVREALSSVRPELRRLLVLRDVLGLSTEEIAGLTGVGVAQLQERLNRARMIVKAAIVRMNED